MANKTQNMAQEIITALKDGTAPWIKPWTPEQSAAPHNPVTGTRYKGVNNIYLSMQDAPDPRWVTFKQAKKNNWQVKRGSKGTTVQFWQFEKEVKSKNSKGDNVKELVKLERPILRHYYVFNGSQIDGIPPIEQPGKNETWDRHNRADQLLKESGAEIQHTTGDKAAYSSPLDLIRMPERRQFNSPDKYYATALHELGHWTGHEGRLDRKLGNVFGSADYAREELRAEIASYMLGMELGIGHDPGQHLAYVDSWIKHLEDHPTEIFKACADAEKINTFILAFEEEQSKEVNMKQPHYIIMEQSGVALSKDLDFLDLNDDKIDRFDSPEAAFWAAEKAKKELGKKLEGSELYVHRVNPPANLDRRQTLETGLTPILFKKMWEQNVGGELPEEFNTQGLAKNIEQDKSTYIITGEPETEKGRVFVSYFSAIGENTNGKSFELSLNSNNGKNRVVRFNNALTLDINDTSDIKKMIKEKGYDGVVLVENGKPISARALDDKSVYKTMFQASKDLKCVYLGVPYEDKNKAKKLGALWSKTDKAWFIPEGLGKGVFAKWLGREAAAAADNPQTQFADFIKEMGGNLKGETPHMDGKIHRIPETGAAKSNKNIAYAGYLDGIPAGWVKNWRGEQKNWTAKGIALTDQDRAKLKKESAEKKAQRQGERQELYRKTAKESEAYTRDLPVATGKENYFTEKNLKISATGAKTDKRNNIVLPMKDVNGKQWSHLTLHPNGFKQILKDSQLQGTLALVGAKNLDEIKGDLNLAEGYSTAATIHEATGQPVLITGTGNNLKHAARALRDKYPEKDIYIMADDDRYLADQGKMNTGRVQGKKAAQAVGGHVIFPDFADAKTSKEHTDFRDMTKIRGKQAVTDYITAQKNLSCAKQRKKGTNQTEPALVLNSEKEEMQGNSL